MKASLIRKDGIIVKCDLNRLALLASDSLKFLGTRLDGPIYREIGFIEEKKAKRYAKILAYADSIL